MGTAKEELIQAIEQARRALNESLDSDAGYDEIYRNSVTLDKLIEEYIVCGYWDLRRPAVRKTGCLFIFGGWTELRQCMYGKKYV